MKSHHLFTLNLIMSFIWLFITSNYEFFTLFQGFLYSYLILWLLSPILKAQTYLKRSSEVVILGYKFIWALIVSSLKVALSIFQKNAIKEGTFIYPFQVRSDVAQLILSAMITLTPGTMAVDMDREKKLLYIHTTFLDETDSIIQGIQNDFENKLYLIFHGENLT